MRSVRGGYNPFRRQGFALALRRPQGLATAAHGRPNLSPGDGNRAKAQGMRRIGQHAVRSKTVDPVAARPVQLPLHPVKGMADPRAFRCKGSAGRYPRAFHLKAVVNH